MAYYWATWLPTALAKDPFVNERMVLVKGWDTRGRPPSQFSFLPSGILDHHTACCIRTGHKPDSCLSGIISGHSGVPGPISQLLGTWTPQGVAWEGKVAPRILVVAAGRANHAGSGEWPWGAPSGNGSAIGIEWCGPPQGTSWPDEVIELRARVDAAILNHNGWPVNRVTTHWEYARPLGRKIDPSGPWPKQTSIAWNTHWDPKVWRETVSMITAKPVPVPPKPTPVPPKPTPTPPKPTPVPPTTGGIGVAMPIIKKGSTGPYVERMQHLLAAAGYLNPANTANYDGVWGNGTESAKIAFDNDHGLAPSPPSDCGQKSWESLLTGKRW